MVNGATSCGQSTYRLLKQLAPCNYAIDMVSHSLVTCTALAKIKKRVTRLLQRYLHKFLSRYCISPVCIFVPIFYSWKSLDVSLTLSRRTNLCLIIKRLHFNNHICNACLQTILASTKVPCFPHSQRAAFALSTSSILRRNAASRETKPSSP